MPEKAQLQEIMELCKLTTQLSSSLPRAAERNRRSKLYHSSLGRTGESLHSLAFNSSSGLGQALSLPSPFTPPESPSESMFLARLQVTEKRSPLGFTCVAEQHRVLSGFHLQTKLKASINLAARYEQVWKELFSAPTWISFLVIYCTDPSRSLLQTHRSGHKH